MFGRRRSDSKAKTANSDERQKEEPLSEDEIDECAHGESLFDAARFNDLDRVIKIFTKGVSMGQVDEHGNTLLHIAAMNGHRTMCRALIVFAAPRAIWQHQNKMGLTAEDLAVDEEIKADLHAFSHTADYSQDPNCLYNSKLINETKKWKKNSKVLFSMDGGGIRALITSQILVHLDGLMNGTLMQRVDYVAGTSCGGLLALLLTTNNRKVEECRRFVFQYKDKVFCGNDMKVPKHNSNGLEYVAKNATGWGEAKMDSITKHRLIVTVANTRTSPSQLVLFRSFSPRIPEAQRKQSEFLQPDRLELWKAARCTSAAPYFFESYHGLSDGGLVANNPTLTLMTDFYQTQKMDLANSDEMNPYEPETVGCVISLGTGKFPVEPSEGIDVSIHPMKNPMKAAKSLLKSLTNAKNLFVLLLKECTTSNGTPVKFSPHLSEPMNLDETDDLKCIGIMWETELYIMTDAYQDMRQLANFLLKKPIDSRDGKENREGRIEQNSNNNKICDKTPDLAKELEEQSNEV
ncbi:hypothetical protein WR25_18286 [Diploscapter pachys]|uniref:phospholipase A2 n=1 Tax=Diploscapter pachys TaxID=2018661 RepID=A0A2A2LEG3_9BILA|nr:hypothetical protein WR25_18286 [Diploscapter pachys]